MAKGYLDAFGIPIANSKEWPLIMWPSNGNDNQRFTLEQKGEYCVIRCKADKRVIDVCESKLGGDVNLYEYHGKDNQLWKLVKVDDFGTFEIQSKLDADYVLDAVGNSSSDNQELCCWKRNGTLWQTVMAHTPLLAIRGASLYLIAKAAASSEKHYLCRYSWLGRAVRMSLYRCCNFTAKRTYRVA